LSFSFPIFRESIRSFFNSFSHFRKRALRFLCHRSGAGSSPQAVLEFSSESLDDRNGLVADYLTVSYRRNLVADEFAFEVELSESLEDWQDDQTVFVRSTANGNGTEKVTVRSLIPISDAVKRFARVRVSIRPFRIFRSLMPGV
jgi:hypothetical protein